MTALKFDKIVSCNLIDRYINYDTKTVDIVLSGSVANGATATFTGTIPYSRTKTRADIYLKNLTTGSKIPATIGNRTNPYTFVSSEVCSHVVYYDGSNITVRISVTNNTGAPINLTTQTIQAQAVMYEVPFNS